jgi:hypothetical protein
MVRGTPGLGSSLSPSSRPRRKRARHFVTVPRLTPSRAATAMLGPPSAQASTIRARRASPCAVLRRLAQLLNVRRSASDSTSGSSLGSPIPPADITDWPTGTPDPQSGPGWCGKRLTWCRDNSKPAHSPGVRRGASQREERGDHAARADDRAAGLRHHRAAPGRCRLARRHDRGRAAEDVQPADVAAASAGDGQARRLRARRAAQLQQSGCGRPGKQPGHNVQFPILLPGQGDPAGQNAVSSP